MIRQYELVERVKSYDPNADEEALNAAYVFAMKAHGSQMRASGDPYFSHPLEVAGILTEMKLDTASIVTALLHDTVEDTDVTLADIEKQFGKDVATLVDGVTKLSMIQWESHQHEQAENFRKLVLAMSNDIRVLLIKLADRLHNMRTLHYLPNPEKRARKARETMEIYVPLAQRIGVHKMKDELEDLAFRELNEDARDSILARLKFLREEDDDSVNFIIHELEEIFSLHNMKVKISGREKTPYSIWRKMRQKNVTFEQMSDIMAFRVVVKDISECYQALGYLHGSYSVIPGRFKDYISTPKANNYQSIHTAVIGPKGHRIEIQIRTADMHETNDYGVAAHWLYKQGQKVDESTQQYKWLRGLLDILDNASDPEEFLENTKLEMFQDHVFCFSPKGDLISLPSGATPIDFAYAVHSEVGNHCVGAKINGRMVPLRTILHNGDQVEITTTKSQTPSPTWERYAVTGKARSAIRRFIRSQKRNQHVELGQSILLKALKAEKIPIEEALSQENMQKIGCKSTEDLYALLGEGLKTMPEVMRVLYPDRQQKERKELPPDAWIEKRSKDETSVSIHGLIPGMAVHYAGCCHPLPGDKIVGIVMTGRGVTVHTDDCDTLQRYADEPDRWLDVSWSSGHGVEDRYTARLRVTLFNKVGALAALTTVVGKNGGNILNLKIANRTDMFFDLILDVEVSDTTHLSNLMAAIRSTPHVNSVDRIKN